MFTLAKMYKLGYGIDRKGIEMPRIRIEKTETQEGYSFVVSKDELRVLQLPRYRTPAKNQAELEGRIGRKFTAEEIDCARQAYKPLLADVPKQKPVPKMAIARKKMPSARRWAPRLALRG